MIIRVQKKIIVKIFLICSILIGYIFYIYITPNYYINKYTTAHNISPLLQQKNYFISSSLLKKIINIPSLLSAINIKNKKKIPSHKMNINYIPYLTFQHFNKNQNTLFYHIIKTLYIYPITKIIFCIDIKEINTPKKFIQQIIKEKTTLSNNQIFNKKNTLNKFLTTHNYIITKIKKIPKIVKKLLQNIIHFILYSLYINTKHKNYFIYIIHVKKDIKNIHITEINKNNYYLQKEKKNTNQQDKIISSNQNNNPLLPKSIQIQLNINHNLATLLDQQKYYLDNIKLKKQKTTSQIIQINQIYTNLIEQSKWLNTSPILGETLRYQISKLPKIPNSQQLNHEMTQLKNKYSQYETKIKKLQIIFSQSKQDNGSPLTPWQKNILKSQLTLQHNLIISLLNNYHTQILELTKLKVTYEELKNKLKELQKTTNHYLFWFPDVNPIDIHYLWNIYQDLHKLLTQDINQQIKIALKIIYTDSSILTLLISCTILSIVIYFIAYRNYQKLLTKSNNYIGKVNQDNFLLTFHNIWYSILISSPIPIIWKALGYSLKKIWICPVIVSIGEGINTTIYILWAFIISAYFASPKGLFTVHFGWSQHKIQKVFPNHYAVSVSIITLLTTMFTVFNNYNEKEFVNNLGRLCFILLCIYSSYMTNNLKNSGLLLYVKKNDFSDNNTINRCLWNFMICAPIITAISCIYGYLYVAQKILIKLEISLFIWIVLLIVYHIIRRWISIQRRRIAFERAKEKRAKQLAIRTYQKFHVLQDQTNKKLDTTTVTNNKRNLDLDTINTQSLQLIRSILTIIAILLLTFLWSELHSAFSFLEKITLWDVTSTIKGVENIQPITLHSFLTAILVITITTKTVRNLPAFLELILLQYLNLTPGTRYAITTSTKYILMLLGSLIGCALIGIEWSKIQWLIAALGVGLGFGLQEIFGNFVSGLMILFEKPIRIGDTITIRNLTGNVTKINTRATTITDWDHKEIIIPNKEFITKKFINWSLSDTITRVVLKIPSPVNINTKKITTILLQIVKGIPLILKTPSPEVYLADLQQGLPIFEIRLYVPDTKSRMLACHQVHTQVLEYYQKNKIKLPYLPNYLYNYSLASKQFLS